MWSYATLFRSHATVAALLLFAFAGALTVRDVHSPRRDLLLGAAVGLATGWATVTEYPAAPAAAILAVLALIHVWPSGPTRIQRVAAGVTAGALICAVVLFSYQYLAFGSPFCLSYAYSTYNVPSPAPEMGNGLFGLTYPRFWILRELLVGRYRGLLLLAPVLTLAPIGFVQLGRRRPDFRPSIAAAAPLAVYYLLLNASYKYWDGGYSTGPRHLSPLVPFLCLALGLLWTWSRAVHRAALGGLGRSGIVVALMAVSTEPMPGTEVKSPLQELFWPAFRSGHLALREGTFNLGQLAGLHGLASLLPLLLIWTIGLASWVWLKDKTRTAHDPLKILKIGC